LIISFNYYTVVPVFDLSMSLGKVKSEKALEKSGNLYSKLHGNPGYVQVWIITKRKQTQLAYSLKAYSKPGSFHCQQQYSLHIY